MGIEVRHESHDVCVDNDIIVIKEGCHMIVVYQRSCDNKARVEIGIKCREK